MFGKFSCNDSECFSCKVRMLLILKVPPLNVTSVYPLFMDAGGTVAPIRSTYKLLKT